MINVAIKQTNSNEVKQIIKLMSYKQIYLHKIWLNQGHRLRNSIKVLNL